MPWCPNCKDEYREGFSICVNCNIELADNLDPIKKPHIGYCTEVYLTSVPNITYADVVESLLRAYGVPIRKKYRNAGDYVKIVYGFTNFGIDIFVPDTAYQVAIGMVPLDGPTPEESGYISTTIETSVGGIKAVWIELLLPIYNRVKGDGVLSKPDMYTKPNGVSRNYILTWDYNGVRYDISTILQSELAMEEAVKIAESFMAAQ